MRSSHGVSEASTPVVVSRRFDWIATSIGRMAFLCRQGGVPICRSVFRARAVYTWYRLIKSVHRMTGFLTVVR